MNGNRQKGLYPNPPKEKLCAAWRHFYVKHSPSKASQGCQADRQLNEGVSGVDGKMAV